MTHAFSNSHDEQYVSSVADALSKHRRADTLEAGDPAPSLPLTRLSGEDMLHLTELVGAGPLMLIFGSYT